MQLQTLATQPRAVAWNPGLQPEHPLVPCTTQSVPSAGLPDGHRHTFSLHSRPSAWKPLLHEAHASLPAATQPVLPGSTAMPFEHVQTASQVVPSDAIWNPDPQAEQKSVPSLVQAAPTAPTPLGHSHLFIRHVLPGERW